MSGFRNSELLLNNFRDSGFLSYGFRNPDHEPKVSGIPTLDLRIPGSNQKSGIPVPIPEVVQYWVKISEQHLLERVERCEQHVCILYYKPGILGNQRINKLIYLGTSALVLPQKYDGVPMKYQISVDCSQVLTRCARV